jgi:hypothetical protein
LSVEENKHVAGSLLYQQPKIPRVDPTLGLGIIVRALSGSIVANSNNER